jgi:hypothetical protein
LGLLLLLPRLLLSRLPEQTRALRRLSKQRRRLLLSRLSERRARLSCGLRAEA